MKVYQILIKKTDKYITIAVQAETEAEALTLAQNEGEVIRILSSLDIDHIIDINYNEQMLNYYPEVIKAIKEFQVMIKAQSFEVEKMHDELTKLLSNAYINTADETRLSMWEQFFGITPLPQGEDNKETWLSDRRETILARLYHVEKLNTKTISEIVQIFTGGETTSYFKDGTIYVNILPPAHNKQFKFENVEQELRKKIPAHLMFQVDRKYYTWLQVLDNNGTERTFGDVKNDFATWKDVLLQV